MARVTGLRERRGGRVAVELDGEPWRELPTDAVVRCAILVGQELDRPRLRELRRELRRSEALAAAGRTLRHRDLSRHALEERLARRPALDARARADAVETLAAAGVVDDGRFARARAEAMARRGWGDAAIGADLRRQGVEPEQAHEAVAALEPERERAVRAAGARADRAAAARALARKGFGDDAIEAAVGGGVADWDRRTIG